MRDKIVILGATPTEPDPELGVTLEHRDPDVIGVEAEAVERFHREVAGQHDDAGFRIGVPKLLQIAGFPEDHQTGGNCTSNCLFHRAELRLNREAGVRKQMLQALAEQAIGFDQNGAGRRHGGFSKSVDARTTA